MCELGSSRSSVCGTTTAYIYIGTPGASPCKQEPSEHVPLLTLCGTGHRGGEHCQPGHTHKHTQRPRSSREAKLGKGPGSARKARSSTNPSPCPSSRAPFCCFDKAEGARDRAKHPAQTQITHTPQNRLCTQATDSSPCSRSPGPAHTQVQVGPLPSFRSAKSLTYSLTHSPTYPTHAVLSSRRANPETSLQDPPPPPSVSGKKHDHHGAQPGRRCLRAAAGSRRGVLALQLHGRGRRGACCVACAHGAHSKDKQPGGSADAESYKPCLKVHNASPRLARRAQDSLTTDELEELEACEQWVQLMSDLAGVCPPLPCRVLPPPLPLLPEVVLLRVHCRPCLCPKSP